MKNAGLQDPPLLGPLVYHGWERQQGDRDKLCEDNQRGVVLAS